MYTKAETDNLISDKQDTITALSYLEFKSLRLSGIFAINWGSVTYGLDVVCNRTGGYWEIARFKSTGSGIGAFLAFLQHNRNTGGTLGCEVTIRILIFNGMKMLNWKLTITVK